MSALGAALRRPEPEPPGQPAEGPDHEPVGGEAPPGRRVREEHARLRLQPRAVAIGQRAKVHRHLRVPGLGEVDEVLAGACAAARRPGTADQDDGLRIVEPETLLLQRRPDRAARCRAQPAQAEEDRDQRHVLEPRLPRRGERRLRRSVDAHRVMLAMVVDG